MAMLDLVNHIERLVRQQGLTRTELAERARISRPALYKLLNLDTQAPALDTLMNLSRALGENPYTLFSLWMVGQTSSGTPGVGTSDDNTRFIADVTYPDGTVVEPGETFVKTWEVANIGKVPWIGRRLVCMDQVSQLYRKEGNELQPVSFQLRPEHPWIMVPDTLPGQSVRLSVTFTAPDTPASVVSYWKAANAEGELYFPEREGLRCCVTVMKPFARSTR